MNGSERLPPIPPGEILLEDFMKPLGISQNALARGLGVPPVTVNKIVHGRRAVTTETAFRLARYFGNTPGFWLNLQRDYDIELAQAQRLPERIASEVRPLARDDAASPAA